MKRIDKLLRSIIALSVAALMLSACGGGSGTSAPVSASMSGTLGTSGTVTGFGSVIVDGVRINDRDVTAGVEQDDDTVINAELKIGQHVDVEHNENLVATKIRISSEVKGPVDNVNTVAGTLTVFGQTVVVNNIVNSGPITVFEAPYTQLSDIKIGDIIEVHGLVKIDVAGAMTLQATRIEKSTVGAYYRVKGNVAELSTAASTFKVGSLLVNYAGAKIKPSLSALVNGAVVYVSIPVTPTFTGTAINAAVIKVKNHHDENQDRDAKLGGVVANLNATAKTFVVDGVKIDASVATFEQSGKSFADLKDGMYVRVKGTYLADGTLKASSIVLRAFERSSGLEIELHGSILNYKSNADFTLRGVAIDASTATIACPGVSVLADNLQVEVEGNLTSSGKVIAVEVKCENTQEGLSTIEREGVASQVDAAARTLVLTSLQNTVRVRWSTSTLFVNVDPAALNGKTLEIEGTLTGDVLLATKIKLNRL